MKIHKLVDVLGAINDTGKLACDMYELDKKHYYSEDRGYKIPVSEMDFQHLVRAFVKLCEQEDMLDRSEHMGTTKDLVAKIEKLDSIVNEKDDYIEHLREKVKGLEDTVQHWYRKYNGLEDSSKTKGHRYVFCEIPNDEYGKKLTRGMKVYLNNESYTMRVRGQHLKKELYGQGKAYHGANIEDCTHLRVYIDTI